MPTSYDPFRAESEGDESDVTEAEIDAMYDSGDPADTEPTAAELAAIEAEQAAAAADAADRWDAFCQALRAAHEAHQARLAATQPPAPDTAPPAALTDEDHAELDALTVAELRAVADEFDIPHSGLRKDDLRAAIGIAAPTAASPTGDTDAGT